MSTLRTASINVRVEPQAKKEAEEVLYGIGLSMADAINIFCKQIAIKRAIPFPLEYPAGPRHLDATSWDKERFHQEIRRGINSEKAGLYDADEVFDEILGKKTHA